MLCTKKARKYTAHIHQWWSTKEKRIGNYYTLRLNDKHIYLYVCKLQWFGISTNMYCNKLSFHENVAQVYQNQNNTLEPKSAYYDIWGQWPVVWCNRQPSGRKIWYKWAGLTRTSWAPMKLCNNRIYIAFGGQAILPIWMQCLIPDSVK
jgi:hypothetical protein